MTSSATSTDRRDPDARGNFQAWHFFLLLSMAGATAAVIVSRETHPAALLLLSAAVICAGLVAIAVTKTVSGFFNRAAETPPTVSAREVLEREKALVLRSLKEIEFDRKTGKISDVDFTQISQSLRARAISLIQEIEKVPEGTEEEPEKRSGGSGGSTASERSICANCQAKNDADASFCKKCGKPL